ncbi:MAG: SEL1-like repeat protein [Chthoniobacter sp.]
MQYSLGFMYAEGRGVQKDVVEAYKWWLLAGDPTTITMDLETVKKEKDAKIIRSNLTPEQREEGERRAREFKPTTPK